MVKVKKYVKLISLFFMILLLYIMLISVFLYFEIFSYNTVFIINYLFFLIIFFLLGFKISKLEERKGYLNGFLIGSSIVIIFTILSLFFSSLNLGSLVYYLSLIVSSMIGGIFGVNKKVS